MSQLSSWVSLSKNVFILLGIVSSAIGQGIIFEDGSSTIGGGNSCVPRSGGSGECLELFSCPAVVKTFRRVAPVVCGFRGPVPIVCCPKPLDSKLQPKPKIVLTPPPDIDFECGHRNGISRTPIRGGVVGGVESVPNSWPWMAALGRYGRASQIQWFCDGVLINRRFVLTAGHCVAFSTIDVVRLGDHDLHKEDVSDLDMRVINRIFHPQYRPPAVTHDLALLLLSTPVTFTQKISPACLPWVEEVKPDLEGRKLTLTGWGATAFGGPMSDVLREVVVTVFPNQRCNSTYKNLRDYSLKFPRGIGNDFMCAGDRNGGKDACQGDSGGPLVYTVFRRYVVGGVVSAGYGCGQAAYPGIYSDVANHLQWIKEVAFS